MKFASLFSGIGGFDLPFEQAGMECVAQVEIDQNCQKVLAAHFPNVKRYRDIREVTALSGRDERSRVLGNKPEVVLANQSPVSQAVAVRTENDAVTDGVQTTRTFGNYMVSIAEGFIPTAIHTLVTMNATESSLPTSLVGVDASLGHDVRHSLVPRSFRTNAGKRSTRRKAFSLRGNPGLVSSNIPPWSVLLVDGVDARPATATARDKGNVLDVPVLMPMQIDPGLSVLGQSRDFCPATAFAKDSVHETHYNTRKYYLPFADVICGGPPCQDLSLAGKRAGLAGARSGLFFEFIRIIKEMRQESHGQFPSTVVIENVPGFLSASGNRDFGTALNALAECGAVDIGWRVIDAQHWVPQRRRRVFIVACFPSETLGRSGVGSAAEILSLFAGGLGDIAPRRETGQRVAATIAGVFSGAGGGNRYGMNVETVDSCITETIGALNTTIPGGGWRIGADEAAAGQLVARGLTSRQSRLDGDADNLIAGTLQSHSKEHGHAMTTQQAAEGNQLVTHTLRPTLKHGGDSKSAHGAYTKPSIAGAFGVRRLMPVECERLQGFPDNWTNEPPQSDSVRYRQLGNAVAVPVAQWLGERIVFSAREKT